MVRRRSLLTAAGTALTAALAGCTDAIAGAANDEDDRSAPGTPDTTTPTPIPAVELLGPELVRRDAGTDDELVSVAGVVESVADAALAEVTVTAEFRDDAETVLATADADFSDMAPGGRWEFRIYFPGSGERAAAVADHSLAVAVER